MKVNLPHKIKIWIQGQSQPVWVEKLESNEKGFPTKVKTSDGKILSRSRVQYSVLVWDEMVI